MKEGRFSIYNLLLQVLVLLIIFILLFPLVVIVVSSFGPAGREYIQFPPNGFSLVWYTKIPKPFLIAFLNSIIIALAASLISVILGVTAAMSLVRGSYPGRSILKAIFTSPLQIPLIAQGVIFLQYYVFLAKASNTNLIDTFPGLVFAHVVVTFPFVLGTVGSVLERFDTALEEAALVHGASKLSAFKKITLPIIAPGIYVGGLYAVIMSFGNVPVSLFLTGSRIKTLPIEIFYALEFDFSPAMLALSTLAVLFSVLMVQLVQRLAGFGLIQSARQ